MEKWVFSYHFFLSFCSFLSFPPHISGKMRHREKQKAMQEKPLFFNDPQQKQNPPHVQYGTEMRRQRMRRSAAFSVDPPHIFRFQEKYLRLFPYFRLFDRLFLPVICPFRTISAKNAAQKRIFSFLRGALFVHTYPDKLDFVYSSDDCFSSSYCSSETIFLSSVIAFPYSFS